MIHAQSTHVNLIKLTHRRASNSWSVLSSWLSALSPVGVKQDRRVLEEEEEEEEMLKKDKLIQAH